jgi:SAM-dependent methyltransferase
MPEHVTEHWDGVYGSRSPRDLGWFQARPETSVRLLTTFAAPTSAVVDVGAGVSTLVDVLLDDGWTDLTVLDVSAEALDAVRARLGERAGEVSTVVSDLRSWRPDRAYDVWHDRAVFHFLVDPEDRRRYVATAAEAVRSGGHALIATFAGDGPTSCSGLPTDRYEPAALAAQLEPAFSLVQSEREEHRTPAGEVQPFTWVVLRRV